MTLPSSPPPPSDPLRKSVVKLFTVKRKPNYYQPWDFEYQRTSGGSGCVIEGQRILTNAHVAAHIVYAQAMKSGNPEKWTIRLEHVDHDSELAIFRVDQPEFFEGTQPIQLGRLPLRQDKVAVYGFPAGGNELSVTEGVVSRIEVRRYTHSHRELLALQTDAAINPGNSGGPVFMGSAMIGIAFQASKQLENTGYVIPVPVIEHFLEGWRRQRLGVPDLGISWQKMESPVLRELAGLGRDQSGVLVTRVIFGGSAWGLLEPGDVLLSIDATSIANDGSFVLRGDDRLRFSHLISQRQVGEHVKLTVLRRGRILEPELSLKVPSELVPRPLHAPPSYLIFGGLVFTRLTYDFMSAWTDWKDVDARFRYLYENEVPSEERREIVLLSQVLAHDVTSGFHQVRGAIVRRVNGMRISAMRDLKGALERPLGAHHVIETDSPATVGGDSSDYHHASGTTVALRAAEAEAALPEILQRYAIAAARSADLAD